MSFNRKTLIKKTMKEHQCFGCLKPITKGSQAIKHSGYHDSWYTHYLHPVCDIITKKYVDEIAIDNEIPEGFVLIYHDYFGIEMDWA